MRIRNGFVSNSSSSSFVILSKEKLTKDKLLKVFNVNESSPFYNFVYDLVNYIINDAKEYKLKDIMENYGVDDIEELPEIYQKAIKNDFYIYEGSASSDSDGVELAFCDMDLNYESEDFIIEKEGGY